MGYTIQKVINDISLSCIDGKITKIFKNNEKVLAI